MAGDEKWSVLLVKFDYLNGCFPTAVVTEALNSSVIPDFRASYHDWQIIASLKAGLCRH